MFGSITLRPLHAPRLWYALWWSAWLALLVASLLPMPQVGLDVTHGDKGLHLLAHGALAGYAWMLFRPGGARWTALAGLAGLGLVIEGLQALLPWRSADGWDVLANLCGTGLGSVLAAHLGVDLLAQLDRRWFGAGQAAE